MSEREDNKKRFDPYTGEIVGENEGNIEDRRENWSQEENINEENKEENKREDHEKTKMRSEENENMAQTKEPTYEKVWEPFHEENKQRYQNENNTAQYYMAMPENTNKKGSDGFAMVCLVLGILSLLSAVSCCFTILSIPLAIAGIIFGILAGKPENPKDKKRFAGLLMSIISIIVTILMAIFLLFMALDSNRRNTFPNEFYERFFYDPYNDDIDEFPSGGQQVKVDSLGTEQI